MATIDDFRVISQRIRNLGQLSRQLDQGDQVIFKHLQEWPEEGKEIRRILKQAEAKLEGMVTEISVAAAISKEQEEGRATFIDKWQNIATLLLPENIAHLPEFLAHILEQVESEYLEMTFKEIRPDALKIILAAAQAANEAKE